MSWILAPLTSTPNGTPRPSISTDRLVPSLPRSVGFLPVFSTQWRLGHRTVYALPLPLNALQLVVFEQRLSPQFAKDAQLGPFLKVTVQRTTETELSREPLSTGNWASPFNMHHAS